MNSNGSHDSGQGWLDSPVKARFARALTLASPWLCDVRSSEWIALVYFAVLTGVAWVRPLPFRRRTSISVVGATICLALVWLARHGTPVERDWAPAAVILIGYYLSGQFFVRASVRFEGWLASWDRRLLGDVSARVASWPPVVVGALDLVYMGTFLLMPLGCALLVIGGHTAQVNRYWTMVAAAEFAAFAPIAFVQTRPPWALESAHATDRGSLRRISLLWVRHASHGANTFPSGHAAGALAVALAILPAMPAAGIVLLAIALMVSVGCVTGRYHYAVDVIAGVVLALVIWIAV